MIDDDKSFCIYRRFDVRAAYRWLTGAACVAAVACLFVSTASHAQQRPLLTHHVRAAVVNGQAHPVGPLPLERHLQLSISLPLRNQAALKVFLKDLYAPKSPSYRKFLTVKQFTDRFGPTPGDYAAVIRFAQANGMTVTETSPNRVLVTVDASVADINKTFHVTMGVYQHPTEPRTFYAPDREPSVDLAIPLWHVTGLDDFAPPRRQQQKMVSGSGPGGYFLGSDMRAAYGGSALTGAGQSIGLFGETPFNMSDVQAYFSTIGQPFSPSVVQIAAPKGFVISCTSGQNCGEDAIDIEQALSMAPGVNAVIEYQGPNDANILNRMATDDIANQLSSSFGWAAADCSEDDQYFEQFEAQGQSFFMAAGDDGAYSSQSATPLLMNCPVDDPWVTEVGGTALATNGAGGSWASETAWSGSGGGISTNGYPIPDYQQLPGVITSANKGSTTLRNVPDVAAEAADDSYMCANGFCSGGWGGTSFATPRWAGFMALVNQQAAINGKSPIGFLNPTLYAIGTGPRYNSDFHDITSGDNFNSGSPKLYAAGTGYDLVTGWGSPNGQNLITDLAGTSACWPRWLSLVGISGFGANRTGKFYNYSAGAEVSYGSVNYTAAIANTDVNPSTHNGALGSNQAWIPSGNCGGASSAVQVILSSMYNGTGIVEDGTILLTANGLYGLDGIGNAYSRTLLGTSQTWNNTLFTLGAPPAYNIVRALGQAITLPSGKFSSLNILATGVNGAEISQTFIVNYTNGNPTTITQSLSDWFVPQNFAGESTAVTTVYRDTGGGATDNRTFNLYGYSFALDNKQTVASIQLPNNSNVAVLAVTLVP